MQKVGTYAAATGRGDDRLCRTFDGADAAGRAVVLKIIHPHLIASEAIRSALRAQLRALVDTSHPNVVRHRDLVEEGEQLALVLDVPQGETLRQRLARVQRLSWPEAVHIAVEIARGLAAVHAASPTVVHGDLKPENILLSSEGAKLVDFDFTWTVKDAQGESTAGFRSLRYMSPEAIDAAGVEPRSDLYGLGLVLYEMLSGTPPFSAQSPRELLNAQCTQAPPPFSPVLRSELPGGLEQLIGRLLEKRREGRPSSAAEVIGYLEGIQRGQPDPAIFGAGSPMQAAGHAAAVSPRTGVKKRALPLLLGVGLVAALGLGVGAYYLLDGSDKPVVVASVTAEQQARVDAETRPEIKLEPSPAEAPDPIPSTNVGDDAEARPSEARDAADDVANDDPEPSTAASEVNDDGRPEAGDEAGAEESQPSALAGVFEQLAEAREAAEREPPASEPTRAQKIASWVNGRLTGHDNRMAAFRVVNITKAGSGHRIFIKNQFQWTCDLDFDSTGSPSKLRNCKSGDPPWNTRTNPINLTCTTDDNRELCRGTYGLKSGPGPGAGSTETMQIIRRLPKPKN
jgi:eukaryotic-like serine/threonine-protein kinase